MPDIMLAITSFALTLGAILILIRLAPRLGLLDYPDQRKHHEGAVPVVGGLALYLILMVLFLSGAATSHYTAVLLIAATFVTLMGAFDDRNHLGPRLRLLMQFLVSLVIVYGADLRLEHLGAIMPSGEYVTLGPLAAPVTIFGIMSVINAMNFIDGLDGLAGGLALFALCGLWFIFGATGHEIPDLIPVLAGGLAAFLLFNARWFGRKKAVLFLGDAGSTLLGMLLAWLMVEHSQGSEAAFSPVIALWLLAIPLIDFLAIVIRRIAKARHPFNPDREHLHHIITRTTNNDMWAVAVIHAVALTCTAIGILGQLNGWPKNVMFYAFLLLFIACFVALRLSSTMGKVFGAINVR